MTDAPPTCDNKDHFKRLVKHMKHFLIVVDLQNDFVSGALGTPDAQEIIPRAAKKIADFDGDIFVTLDTHSEHYLETSEGKHLPVVHCVKGTTGWQLNETISAALAGKRFRTVEKPTFGAVELPALLGTASEGEDFDVTLIGLCTDICVVSNALLLKAHFYEKEIRVDAACCAGVTPESHEAALTTMRMCQIIVQ